MCQFLMLFFSNGNNRGGEEHNKSKNKVKKLASHILAFKLLFGNFCFHQLDSRQVLENKMFLCG